MNAADTETLEVVLLNVPLLIHAAWQEHAQALMRENLLADLSLGGERDPIGLHAEITDVLSLLTEAIPAPQTSLRSEELMDNAVEPRVTAERVDLRVPVRSVPHFATLDATLQTAAELADRDLMLTPATQPELRGFRRWLCREVARQVAGKVPTAWSPDSDLPAITRPDPAWDAGSVVESSRALVAAGDTNRIIAVSRSALELLGYVDPDQLVGQRIIAIIPERYRQAHVAGFTMHLLSGRDAVLRRSIQVPALCHGEGEIEVELTVHDHNTPDGRKVFVAELRRP